MLRGQMHRRRFLELVGTAAATSACRPEATVDPRAVERATTRSPFAHGVASGDPTQDGVVLWTRVEADGTAEIDVDWVIALRPDLSDPVAQGHAVATIERDHTVKVDARGLAPGRSYYYGFTAQGVRSPIGRTRTLPAGSPAQVVLAVVSCANLPRGHFNAYGAIAARDDVAVVVHLGDYLYEYANGRSGDGTAMGRVPDPADRECTTLVEYRRRHACYKRDAQLMAMHARHPMIAVWDDHEIANNTWLAGAENHQPDEGAFAVRRQAAIQAWREWMPVRDVTDAAAIEIHRSFRFGDLLELFMLDTRIVGRDRQLPRDDWETLTSRGRSLLGPDQERWLLEGLRRSVDDGVAWRTLGQQVLMTQVRDADGLPRNTDMWDGYPAARDRILGFLHDLSIPDVVVLTGDIHSSWATLLHRDPFAATPGPVLAVELTAPAVSSPPPAEPPDLPTLHAAHPHVRWVDVRHRGYLTVRYDAREAIATWHHTDDVARVHLELPARKAFRIPRGRPDLVEIEPA
jgi:alkaline phosphatase D